jgi:3-dehydroquinate dehydratase-1
MTRENPRKAESARPQIVAVIASRADLDAALRMKNPPDLFELRLDLFQPGEHELPRTRPLIVTARHPAEGGANKLSTRERRRLLEQYIASATYVDVELRSIAYVNDLRDRRMRTIISFHDLRGTPSLPVLRRKLDSAKATGADIFKLATTVNGPPELDRLLRFFDEAIRAMPVAAMGMGALGRESRVELARRGSQLNYGYISRPQAPGQLSVVELRRLLGH